MYLVGENLKLRNIELSDANFVKEVENNPETWEYSTTYAPYSSYSIEEYIKSEYLGLYENKQQRFVIENKETKKSVGLIDIFNFDPYNSTAELGIYITKEERCKGYAKESVDILLDYAFNHLSIYTFIVTISTDNTKAIKLFNADGFETVGVLKGWKKWKNDRKDVMILQKNRE